MFKKFLFAIVFLLPLGAGFAAMNYGFPGAAARKPALVPTRATLNSTTTTTTTTEIGTPAPEPEDWQAKELERAAADAVFQMNHAREVCSGISTGLASVQEMLGIGTVLSGVGTLAGGVATGAGFWKADVNDKKPGGKQLSTGLSITRTAGDGTTTLTSVGNAIASGKSVGSIGALIIKMDECNKEIQKFQTARALLASAGADDSDPIVQKINAAITNCPQFDSANLESIRKTITASAWVSGVGAVAGALGTAASGITLYKEAHGQDGELKITTKKTNTSEKGVVVDLNLTANISSATATATSLISTILGAVVLEKLKNDATNAVNCEETLM